MPATPAQLLNLRLRPLTQHGPRVGGRFVLYWMQQFRRCHHNHALQHAVYRAREAQVPLLIYEALRVDYPHASDRHHAFALMSMLDHRRELAERSERGQAYLPWVEQEPGQGKGLVAALCEQAVEVVTDDVPAFIVPGHNRALARIADAAGIRATAVDGNGILPIRLLDQACPTAAVFRRHAHKHLGAALAGSPTPHPLGGLELPPFEPRWLSDIHSRWGRSDDWLDRFAESPDTALGELPIDHEVPRVPDAGGRQRALALLRSFLDKRIDRYGERSNPAVPATSGLSPYLHWGQISAHEVLRASWERERDFDPGLLPEKGGARLGYWPLSEPAQVFLDELVTWRELGYHTAALWPDDHTRFSALPEWARSTMADHASDRRDPSYRLKTLEAARTHDEIWNAAQRQLREDGIIHNYLRMLWGKLILQWAPKPETAYEWAIHLNNKWGLDGRNPNSWAGVLWCFGRYDRPWQERAIFGTIRCMTSDSTRRKFQLDEYLERYGEPTRKD